MSSNIVASCVSSNIVASCVSSDIVASCLSSDIVARCNKAVVACSFIASFLTRYLAHCSSEVVLQQWRFQVEVPACLASIQTCVAVGE